MCHLLQWDVRSGEITQEYDRHLGAVNTITFVDENRRFVTTSDDKSLRVWEWYDTRSELRGVSTNFNDTICRYRAYSFFDL